uniref:Uncharacterized protein n=1 Tax=Anguilla anguilla TaxID=7936 RepID=A0A0E9XH54_ANGAN
MHSRVSLFYFFPFFALSLSSSSLSLSLSECLHVYEHFYSWKLL